MAEKHKTMLLLDAQVWRRFQEEVLRQDGGRATSNRVEKLIAATDPAPIVDAVATAWPCPRRVPFGYRSRATEGTRADRVGPD